MIITSSVSAGSNFKEITQEYTLTGVGNRTFLLVDPNFAVRDCRETRKARAKSEVEEFCDERLFTIGVHYFGYGVNSSAIATNNVIEIYINGVLVRTYQKTLSTVKQLWRVASVSWPSRNIAFVDTVTVHQGY